MLFLFSLISALYRTKIKYFGYFFHDKHLAYETNKRCKFIKHGLMLKNCFAPFFIRNETFVKKNRLASLRVWKKNSSEFRLRYKKKYIFTDKPGPATITYEPKRVVKKGSLNITCSVLDLGRPEVTGFKWFRGSHQISGEESAVLRIESVNLETKANFTCMAFNEAGDGDPATVFIDVAGS